MTRQNYVKVKQKFVKKKLSRFPDQMVKGVRVCYVHQPKNLFEISKYTKRLNDLPAREPGEEVVSAKLPGITLIGALGFSELL